MRKTTIIIAITALVMSAGTAGAAGYINGSKIKPHTITGTQVKAHSLPLSVLKDPPPQGANGSQGANGAQGTGGANGTNGAAGTNGSAGDKGDTGNTGSTGPAGQDLTASTSVYHPSDVTVSVCDVPAPAAGTLTVDYSSCPSITRTAGPFTMHFVAYRYSSSNGGTPPSDWHSINTYLTTWTTADGVNIKQGGAFYAQVSSSWTGTNPPSSTNTDRDSNGTTPVAFNLTGDVFAATGHLTLTRDGDTGSVSNITAYVIH